MDDDYIKRFDAHRNLIPVLSLEGTRERTDARRGSGVYTQLLSLMERLSARKILYGVSITVTSENLWETTQADFAAFLLSQGCRLVFLVEYVPADPAAAYLAPSETDRVLLARRLEKLRRHFPGLLFLSFPGDEEAMGGCLAAGRCFFHIGPHGEVEACPFSPYGDRNLRESTLLEALCSPLFARLQSGGLMEQEHAGGCALFGQERAVQALLSESLEQKVEQIKSFQEAVHG